MTKAWEIVKHLEEGGKIRWGTEVYYWIENSKLFCGYQGFVCVSGNTISDILAEMDEIKIIKKPKEITFRAKMFIDRIDVEQCRQTHMVDLFEEEEYGELVDPKDLVDVEITVKEVKDD